MFFKINKLNNMKTIKYMLSVVAVLAVLASCNRKETFQHEKFVSFGSGSYAVSEDAGIVSVPVHVYNVGSDEVTVTIKATDGTAKTGTNYEIIEPASGVLNFAPGETEKNVQVLVKNLRDKFTGNLNFTLALTSVTDGVATGSFSNINFTINDKDHPLAKFFGTWAGSITGIKGTVYPMEITVEAVEGDETYRKLRISNFEPMLAKNGVTSNLGFNIFTGIVDESLSTITISAGQQTGYEDQDAGDPVFIMSTEGGDIVISYSDGKLVVPGFGTFVTLSTDGKTYYYEKYEKGCTLTKK